MAKSRKGIARSVGTHLTPRVESLMANFSYLQGSVKEARTHFNEGRSDEAAYFLAAALEFAATALGERGYEAISDRDEATILRISQKITNLFRYPTEEDEWG